MNYEYRVFVVDGVPVTGAGCVEARTPLENTTLFDPWMENKRNQSEPEEDISLAARYKAFAHRVAFFLKEEGLLDYTLDLFHNSSIGIVELNPIHHSGFYACDYSAIFRAIKDI
jgi:hypothetical protein